MFGIISFYILGIFTKKCHTEVNITILEEINKKINVPTEHQTIPVKLSEAEFIYNFLTEKKIKRTLETGFAYARSASHIIAATNSPHITIDPYQEDYKLAGVENIRVLGFEKLLDFRNDFSHNVLPQLVKENRTFEFIFIDGDHRFDGEFIDFYFSDLLLEKDGYILLHDTWMRSTRLLMKFIITNRNNYRYIKTPLRNFALFKKTGKDNRHGMFFREFYTIKSLITHNMIFWLSTGKKQLLKRIIIKIKDKLK